MKNTPRQLINSLCEDETIIACSLTDDQMDDAFCETATFIAWSAVHVYARVKYEEGSHVLKVPRNPETCGFMTKPGGLLEEEDELMKEEEKNEELKRMRRVQGATFPVGTLQELYNSHRLGGYLP